MPVGRYRDLTPSEIAELNQLIAPSSKTEEASLPKVSALTQKNLKENRNWSTNNRRNQ